MKYVLCIVQIVSDYPVILGPHLISYSSNKFVLSKKANEINTPESIQSTVSIGGSTMKPKLKKVIAFSKLD
jgi:hypothetical protein